MKAHDEVSAHPVRFTLLVVLAALILTQRLLDLRFQWARDGFRWLSTPVFLPFEWTRGLGGTLAARLQEVDVLRARLEDAEQRAARAELRARLGEEAHLEAERLEQALAVQGETRGRYPREPLFAHVVGRSPHPNERRITLDRGREHGVVADSPVVFGEDVVGRVLQIFPGRCRVLLIDDPLSAVGVLVEGDRSPGVARGTGDGTLELADLPEDSHLVEGIRILTGSLSAYFPKGLVVGTLELEGETWRVRPRRDLVRLEEAFILPLGGG